MVYWKSERFWLGKLLEHPEIMTQGETLEELEENLKDAMPREGARIFLAGRTRAKLDSLA